MRLSQFPLATLREEPSGDLPAGFRRLLRAGYIRGGGADAIWLPLGVKWLARVTDHLAESLERRGWTRVHTVAPGWPENSDTREIAQPAIGSQSWSPRPPSPVLTNLIHSYKRLPLRAFQLGWRRRQTQEGDSLPSPMRLVLDAWAITGQSELQELGKELARVAEEMVRDLGLDVMAAPLSDGPNAPVEFCTHALGRGAPMLGCARCGWISRPPCTPVAGAAPGGEAVLDAERVATPGANSITELCAQLGIVPEQTAKAMLFAGTPPGVSQHRLLMVMVRGEREVSWQKVGWASGWSDLRRALPTEVEEIGAVAGYASPIGLAHSWVLVDQDVASSRNLATGANEAGYHLVNTNYGRDYSAWQVADLVTAGDGDACPNCGSLLSQQNGYLLGTATSLYPERGLRLGDFVNGSGETASLAGAFLDLDVTTILGALAEEQADERGLAWRPTLAPFKAEILGLPPCEAQALELYMDLAEQGVRVLLDDREMTAGVKFKDADLIGLPVRVVISPKSIAAGGAEITARAVGERFIVPLDSVGREIDKYAS